MNQEEKQAILFTQDQEGKISETKITEEQLGEIFFNEGNREWDNIQAALPEAVWEKLYSGDHVVYEGYTVDHKPFGAGRTFYWDGKPYQEGIFGLKGLLCGRLYYVNGMIRFEGQFRLNQAYGPNYPEYGTWYDQKGKMLYRGKFKVLRSSLGWPHVHEPEGFGCVPETTVNGHTFIWDDARRLMKKQDAPEKKKAEEVLCMVRLTSNWRDQNLPQPIVVFMERWEKKAAKAMETYQFQWPAKGVETLFTFERIRYQITPATFGIPDDLCEIFQTNGLHDELRGIPGVTDVKSYGGLD